MIAFFFLLFILIIISIALVGTIFWIWMIVDCAQNRFLDSNTRLVWILVIVFTHLIGALIYFFAGRRPRNAMINTYPGYAQGPAQYTPNQMGYNQSYAAGSTQYAPPNPNAYRNAHQGQSYQSQQSPQPPQHNSGERQYYESPQATYPHQQFSKPQE